MVKKDVLNSAINILFENGYDIESISRILRSKSTASIKKALVNVEQGYNEPRPLLYFTNEDQKSIEAAGLTVKVKDEFKLFRLGNTTKKVVEREVVEDIQPIAVPEVVEVESSQQSVLEQEKTRVKKLMNQPDVDGVCSVCDNDGVVFIRTGVPFENKTVVCPKCLGTSKNRKPRETYTMSEDRLLEQLIPNHYYRNIPFDIKKLEEEAPIPQELKNFMFDNYLQTLEKLVATFKMGEIPKKSILLSAPDGFGKKHAIYECIKESVRHGISCTPLYDMAEVIAFLNERKYTELNDILDKEVIFLSISGSGREMFADSYKYLLDYCERYGKPLIMISRYESTNIMKHKTSFRTNIKLDWYDVFKPVTHDYDYGHLENQGIYGSFAREIYTYRGKELAEYTKFSPANMKNSSVINRD